MKKFFILTLLILNSLCFKNIPEQRNETFPAMLFDTNLILVNKHYYLLKDYVPNNLVNIHNYPVNSFSNSKIKCEVIIQYQKMVQDLSLDSLYIYSAYRTYARQKELYEYYNDERYSAKPGFSEHQTGLAIDISTLDAGLTDYFAQTKEYEILMKNCYKYGFILRYPKGKENITEYNYEPWHFRYVGQKYASYIMNNNLTLEEYIYLNFY